MNITIDWDKVIHIEKNLEDDNIYSISVAFDNGEAMTYGYTDFKKFIKDCTYITNKLED